MQALSGAGLEITRYHSADTEDWNRFIATSKNGTFLFNRGFMDYHADRFEDFSLMVRRRGHLLGVIPANRIGATVHSHQGLTYGGIISGPDMTTPTMMRIFDATVDFLRRHSVVELVYKTVPSIYHALPAEEDLYAMFSFGGALYRRDVLSVLQMDNRPAMQDRRRRGAKKASAAGVTIVETSDQRDWAEYWSILHALLAERHECAPVHSLDEILLLAGRFPENIRLFLARDGAEATAGIVVFETARVAHVQYIAASRRGREQGALDHLFTSLLDGRYKDKLFFDFGISNEDDGRVLNTGLIEQKEGFGGRAIVHDHYRLAL